VQSVVLVLKAADQLWGKVLENSEHLSWALLNDKVAHSKCEEKLIQLLIIFFTLLLIISSHKKDKDNHLRN
jgi:hypothetical protein